MKLCKEQKDALNQILDMKRCEKALVTGKAGTGKSVLMREVMKKLNSHRIKSIICAPTGIAAQASGGVTIHSLFRINPFTLKYFNNYKKISKFDYILIDEISMVNQVLFDLILEILENCKARIVMFGDFYQLPPVEGELCIASKSWQGTQIIKLKTIHRQKDEKYIEALNDVRYGKLNTPRYRELIQKCKTYQLPVDCTLITPFRKRVETVNRTRVHKICKEVYTSKMLILKGDIKKNQRLPEVLEYGENANILFLINDPDYRFVNGTFGKIVKVYDNYVKVEIDNNTYNILKMEYEVKNADDKVIFRCIQYPFQLGYACTIHKSQGMTLEKIAVDMNDHFGKGMTYTALSRCRSSEGLSMYYGNFSEI